MSSQFPPRDEFYLDPRDVRRSFDAASATYDRASSVQAEIRSRLLQRLDVVRLEPKLILDLGSATGAGARALTQRYASAQVIALDVSPLMLQAARRHQGWLRKFGRIAGDATSLPLRGASVDLVFSNLMLQWCNEPHRVFAEVGRVLRPGGLLTFTTLGPDTLKELREAWRRIDPRTHVNRFIDMHDLGDALIRSGFADPVMDTERLTVTYSTFELLAQDLKKSGSHNINADRPRGLTGRGALRGLREHLETLRRDGVLPATLEVVYGHAWASERRRGAAVAGEVRVPLGSVGRRRL
jgi:malonyl-CoA O-methyltransferase